MLGRVLPGESLRSGGRKQSSPLGIDLGQTTSDGRFTLEPVSCVGNCAVSPSVAWAVGRMTGSDRLDGAWVNLAVVTLGNVIGGTGLVALAYWFVYLRHGTQDTEPSH